MNLKAGDWLEIGEARGVISEIYKEGIVVQITMTMCAKSRSKLTAGSISKAKLDATLGTLPQIGQLHHVRKIELEP